MKTLYLHIGSPKTGSTSIQEYLDDNRLGLINKGVVFCQKGKINNDEFSLAVSTGNIQKIRSFFKSFLKEECNKYILSSENLFWLGDNYNNKFGKVISNEESIKTLKKIAFEFFDVVYVLVYLRPQAEFINSMYIQDVQFMYDGSVSNYADKFEFDYIKVLSLWEKHFDIKNIKIKVFGSELFKKGLLVDFFKGLDIPFSVGKEYMSNQTITTELFYFKRRFNKALELFDFKPNGILFRFFGYIDLMLAQELASSKKTHIELSNQDCIHFDNKYALSNELLFKKYNLDGLNEFNSDRLSKKIQSFNTLDDSKHNFLLMYIRLVNLIGKYKYRALLERAQRLLSKRESDIDDISLLELSASLFMMEYNQQNKKLNISDAHNLSLSDVKSKKIKLVQPVKMGFIASIKNTFSLLR